MKKKSNQLPAEKKKRVHKKDIELLDLNGNSIPMIPYNKGTNDAMFDIIQKNRGRPVKYSIDGLLQKFLEYTQWAQNNPLYGAKFEKGKMYKDPRMRPWSERGFRLYAGIAIKTYWCYMNGKDHDGNDDERYKAYMEVCAFIKEACYNQKLEGATADLMNASIIARDIGLVDKKEVNGTIITGEESIEFE